MTSAIQSTTLAPGQKVLIETSSLPSGVLELQGFSPPARQLKITDAKSDAGVALTASATGGAMGVSRTAGTSLALVGEATSSSAKTDKAIWEIILPETYQPGAAVLVDVNCLATGGTITAGSTTMTVAAYTELNGVETALTVSAAQQIPAVATDLIFTITASAAMLVGSRIVLELVMLVTTSVGAGTGQVNSVTFLA